MSSISAGTSAGTSLVQTGDTTGALVIKTGSSASTAATFNADQTTTLAQPLPVASGGTGATTLSGITVGNATTATSATTATNLAGGSIGTIPYQSANGTTAMLAVGTAGQVLQTNGASAPSWTTPATGAMALISTATASSSSYIIFTGLNYSTYKQYMVLVSGAVPNNSGYTFCMQMSNDNGATYKTGSTAYYFYSLFLGTSTYNNQGYNESYIAFQTPSGTNNDATFGGVNLNIYLNSLTNSNRNSVYAQGFSEDPSAGGAPIFGGGQLLSTAGPINAIRFFFNGGRLITSGTFKLYGIT